VGAFSHFWMMHNVRGQHAFLWDIQGGNACVWWSVPTAACLILGLSAFWSSHQKSEEQGYHQ
jgi:hypothetical protein